MLMHTFMTIISLCTIYTKSEFQRQWLSLLEYPHVELDLIDPKDLDDESRIGNDIRAPKREPGLLGTEEVASIILKPGQTLQGTGFQIIDPQDIRYKGTMSDFGMKLTILMAPELRKAFNELHSTLPPVNLTARDITRWRMAWRACRPRTQTKPSMCGAFYDASSQQLLTRWCRDWPEWYQIINVPIFLGFTAAAFIYGGLHALAWSAHFDSATEKLLWRISSCVVMGGLPVILSIAGWKRHLERKYRVSNGIVIGTARSEGGLVTKVYDPTFRYTFKLILMVSTLMLVAYLLARAYLVVECFINVFHLPAGVFETPEWSTYFPHIS